MTRLRRLVLLTLLVLLLATAAPGSAGPARPRQGDGALPDAGPLPYIGTCSAEGPLAAVRAPN